MNDMRIMTVLKGNEKYRKYQLLLSNYRAAACHVGPQSVNNSLQQTEKKCSAQSHCRCCHRGTCFHDIMRDGLTLKGSITIAVDHKSCDIFSNFRKK